MNNLPKVVTQQRRGRASNPRLLDRKSDGAGMFSLKISYTISFAYLSTFSFASILSCAGTHATTTEIFILSKLSSDLFIFLMRSGLL